MNISKIFFTLFTKSKIDKGPENEAFIKISKIRSEDLREFLINNRLQGELLLSVSELRTRYSDLSNYQAVEILMDQQDDKSKLKT